MVSYMFKCQKSNSTGLSYESRTTKILVKDGNSLDHETSSSTHGQTCDKALSIINVCVDDGNLENVPMEVDVKDNAIFLSEEKFIIRNIPRHHSSRPKKLHSSRSMCWIIHLC